MNKAKSTLKQNNEKKQAVALLKYFDKNRTKFSGLLCEKTGKIGYADIYDSVTKTAIEVSEIYDDNFQPSNMWFKAIKNFKREVRSHPLYKKIKGLYFVSTPRYLKSGSFQFSSPKDKKYITDFLETVLKTKDESEILVKNKYKFKIKKLNDTDKNISFSQNTEANWVNDIGIFYQGLKNKIKKANNQLSRAKKEYSKQIGKQIRVNKKILLIVSKTIFYERNPFSKALLKVLHEERKNISDIDEIWVESDIDYDKNPTDQKFYYQKNFFKALVTKDPNLFTDKTPGISINNQVDLFTTLLLALIDSENYKDVCWYGLKKLLITINKKPHQIFKDKYRRESISQTIEYLTDQQKYKDAWWLVDQIIDDPDPAEPGTESYKKLDPQFNYDLQITNNDKEKDHSYAITTVRGHLVWAIKKLINTSTKENPTNLFEGYKRIKHILDSTKNKYLILQCLYAQSDITARRWWFLLNSKEDEYKDLRQYLLDQNNSLIEKYSKYYSLADALIHVLNNIKDLNEKEMIFVLKNLLYAEQGYVLLIYFAIYREKHYQQDTKDPAHREVVDLISKYNNSTFDYKPDFAQELLKDILDKNISKTEINKTLINPINDLAGIRSEISWQFWKICKEQPEEFENLEEWISKLFTLPYETNLFHNLELMLLDVVNIKRDIAFQWFKKLINSLYLFISKRKENAPLWHDLEELIGLFNQEIGTDKALKNKIDFLRNSKMVYV